MKNRKGQAAIESLFAVIILLGMLLVISLIAVQQQGQADALKKQEEQATLCRQIAGALEAAQNLEGQSSIALNITQPAYIRQSSIEFTLDGSGYYCYFNGTAILSEPTPGAEILEGGIISLSAQEYSLTKNSANQAVIGEFCVPKTCATVECTAIGDSCECIGLNCACGTFDDTCGGRIFCTNGCACDRVPNNQPPDPPCKEGEWVQCPATCADCGNEICEAGETRDSCIGDCESNCGNDVCEEEIGENPDNCEVDCGCGNGECELLFGETANNCLVDCHCGDGICQGDEYPPHEYCETLTNGETIFNCDIVPPQEETCEDQGFPLGGVLDCSDNCEFDTTGCITCTDECSPAGSQQCYDFGTLEGNEQGTNSCAFLADSKALLGGSSPPSDPLTGRYRICGHYDDEQLGGDPCLEWSSVYSCPGDVPCVGGYCMVVGIPGGKDTG